MNDSALPAYGIGTFGSRTTQVSGTAVLLAAEATRGKAFQLAEQLLEAAPKDLVIEDGKVMVRGVPARAVELARLVPLVKEQPDLVEHETAHPVNGVPIEGLSACRDLNPS